MLARSLDISLPVFVGLVNRQSMSGLGGHSTYFTMVDKAFDMPCFNVILYRVPYSLFSANFAPPNSVFKAFKVATAHHWFYLFIQVLLVSFCLWDRRSIFTFVGQFNCKVFIDTTSTLSLIWFSHFFQLFQFDFSRPLWLFLFINIFFFGTFKFLFLTLNALCHKNNGSFVIRAEKRRIRK